MTIAPAATIAIVRCRRCHADLDCGWPRRVKRVDHHGHAGRQHDEQHVKPEPRDFAKEERCLQHCLCGS